MPERYLDDQTVVVLKFAAGDDDAREQLSSTWYVRVTRGFEVFVLNYSHGGDNAHLSIHRDGRCHYKVRQGAGQLEKSHEWDLPPQLDDAGLRRLLTVGIPHVGLSAPGVFHADTDTVLIPAPEANQQIEVDLLLEPGAVPTGAWPAQTALNSGLVGRATLYVDEPERLDVVNFTAVFTYRPEDDWAIQMSRAVVSSPEGSPAPSDLRVLRFSPIEVDGQTLPYLLEMPLGDQRATVDT